MQPAFFKSYLKLASRNLIKRKGSTLINIFGLVLGFTCCLLIFQYVAYERSYDEDVDQSDKVYRLRLDLYREGTLAWQSASVFPGIAPAMKSEIPEVESAARLLNLQVTLTNTENNSKHYDSRSYYADPSFLQMFGVKMLRGDKAAALDAPDKIVLSETAAKVYFGNQDPIGKTLRFRTPGFDRTLWVTGVYKDFPDNSHLKPGQLISYSTLSSIARAQGDSTNMAENSWGWYDFYTYFKLKPHTSLSTVQSKLAALANKNYNDLDAKKKNNLRIELNTVPLRDIHLYSRSNQEAEINGDGKAISFLFLISFLIISIAWINYINLTTAKSLERAREVGVRKVLGAERMDLIRQFMMESFLLNFTALIIAVIATFLLTPWFRQFTGVGNVSFDAISRYWLLFAVIFLAGTALSGIYPALVLSNFKPVIVLKGAFKNNKSGVFLRKGLIIWQFATSIILITTTLIIFQQVQYMRNQNLGVNIKQTLVMDGSTAIQDTLYQQIYPSFKSEMSKIAGVQSVTASNGVMGREVFFANLNNKLGANDRITLYNIGVDYDFIPAYHLKFISGRNFSREFADEKSAILNEEALKLLELGSPEQALNQKFVSQEDTVRVVGIISNYHHEALQKKIPPIIMRLMPGARTYYSVKVETDNVRSVLGKMQDVWNKYFPDDSFNYYFLDELFNRQYKANEQFGKVFNIFSILSVFISCIGLLGLSAFNVAQRAKEMSIRKVLGASVSNLLFLLSKDFVVLVAISFLLGVPVAWWIVNKWLQNFAYRIDVKLWVFVYSGAIMLAIALLTIWGQAFKSVKANPVKSLRTE